MQASQRWLEVHRHDGPSDLMARAATVEMDSETGDFGQVTGSKEVCLEGKAVTAPRAPHLGLGPQDLGKHVHSSDLRVRHFRAGSRFGRAERSRALMSVAQAASTRGTSPEDADNLERDYRFDVLGRGNSSVSCPTRRSLRSEAREARLQTAEICAIAVCLQRACGRRSRTGCDGRVVGHSA